MPGGYWMPLFSCVHLRVHWIFTLIIFNFDIYISTLEILNKKYHDAESNYFQMASSTIYCITNAWIDFKHREYCHLSDTP